MLHQDVLLVTPGSDVKYGKRHRIGYILVSILLSQIFFALFS